MKINVNEAQDIKELVQQLGAVAPLTSLIDEIVLESVIEDYSLRTPAPIENLMQNEDYIRNVLGIEIPLNESYPYSPHLQERILEEQLLFEGFFDDAKQLAGNMKTIALALRYVFSDPSRIKSFMGEVYNAVIKNPLEKLISIIKKVKDVVLTKAKDLAAKGWDKIDDYLGKFADLLENTWDKVQNSKGWKAAMLTVGVGAAVSYIWTNYEDIWETLQDMVEKLVDFGKKEAKEEAVFVVPALGQLILSENDDQLNEFLGGIFGKKNKEADEMGLEVPQGTPAPTDGILISPDQAKKAGIKGKSAEEAKEEKEGEGGGGEEEDEEKSMVQKILDFIKEKIMDKLTDAIKGLAVDALLGAVSGGVASAIKTLGKLYGGAQFVAKILASAAEPFVSKIKNPEEEMKEMEKGEDDPTEAAWHDDEKLIREYVRLKLLAAS